MKKEKQQIRDTSATVENVIQLVATLEMEINIQLIKIRKRLDKLEKEKK